MLGFFYKKKVMKWKRVSKGVINEPLIEYLEKIFIGEMSNGYTLKVYIGTDSQRRRGGYNFATAIVIALFESMGRDKFGKEIFKGRGGIKLGATYFDGNQVKGRPGVKERMLKEVSKSIEVAYEISPLLDLYDIPLEIHADVNPDIRFDSNKALSEAVGYIMGMGYEFKVKPDAWAASSGADRLC